MIWIIGHKEIDHLNALYLAYVVQECGLPGRVNYRIDRGWYLRFD